ncbi:MAG: hypothetical protein IJ099_00615 [Alphaproteobacteria bacterium]|nr:hypothetical protein [Alphaproteobacteria bacterium]
MNKTELNPIRLGLHMAVYAVIVIIALIIAGCSNDYILIIAAISTFLTPLFAALKKPANIVGFCGFFGGLFVLLGGGWLCLAIFIIACITARYSVNYDAVNEVEE